MGAPDCPFVLGLLDFDSHLEIRQASQTETFAK
jgi:hypothetical protein